MKRDRPIVPYLEPQQFLYSSNLVLIHLYGYTKPDSFGFHSNQISGHAIKHCWGKSSNSMGKHVPAMDIKGDELNPMSKCPCLPKEPRTHEFVGPCLLVKLNPHLLWNMKMWLPPIPTASHQCSWQFPFAGWNGWIRQCLHLDLVTWNKSAWFPEVLDHYPLVI